MKSTFLSVLGISLLAILVGLYLSSTMEGKPNLGMPWQVEQLPDGSSKVFQITLGQTTLAQAEQIFQSHPDITLFVPEQSPGAVEAYFNEVYIGGFKAKMVISFDFTEQQIAAMYDRGIRVATLGSGTRKVTLHEADIAEVKNARIIGMTYLPSINIDADVIEKRFGEPDEKITDSVSGGQHWLYPDRGLDITLSEEAKEVFQYVLPSNFSKLRRPLIETNKS